MDKELERRLESIENKIVKLNDRDARRQTFKMTSYSMALGAIIALFVTLVIELVKILFPTKVSTFIGFALYGCLLIIAVIWVKTKEIMDLGDFKITGNVEVSKNKRRKLMADIIHIIRTKNRSLNFNFVFAKWEGLHFWGYLYNTFRESNKRKIDYCFKNAAYLKTLSITMSANKNRDSGLNFDFQKKKFAIYLDEREFSSGEFKSIISELRSLSGEFSFFDKEKSDIKGL